MNQNNLSNDEYLKEQREVVDCLQSDASESDKRMIMEYTESLAMICSGVRGESLEVRLKGTVE